MMNLWFKVGHVWILCLVFSFLTSTCAGGAQPDKEKEIDRLAKAYRAARTEFDRRTVCLDAIDAGVIARGRPVAVVDAIFGTDYVSKLPTGSELETGVVDFHPLTRPPSDKVAVAYGHTGWYLAFKFDSSGTLQDYHLSNLHK